MKISNPLIGATLFACILTANRQTQAADAKPADTSASASAPVVFPVPESQTELVLGAKCDGASGAGTEETGAVAIALFGPVLATLAEKAVGATLGYGYDKIEAWLKNRQLEYTASSTSTKSTRMYGPKGVPLTFGCIEVVRGALGETRFDQAIYDAAMKQFPKDYDPAPVWRPSALADSRSWNVWHLSSPPELYIALKVSYASAFGTTASGSETPLYFSVTPVEALYLRSGAKRNDNKDGKRVALQISMTTVDGKAIFDQTFDLGMLKLGKTTNLRQQEGKFVPLPVSESLSKLAQASPDTAAAAAAANRGTVKKASKENKPTPVVPSQSTQFDPVPVTIKVTVTESDDGGDFSRTVSNSMADAGTRTAVVDGAASAAAGWVKEKLGAK